MCKSFFFFTCMPPFVILYNNNLNMDVIDFIVISICISLITNNTEHFSYVYWAFVFLPLRSIYSDHLLVWPLVQLSTESFFPSEAFWISPLLCVLVLVFWFSDIGPKSPMRLGLQYYSLMVSGVYSTFEYNMLRIQSLSKHMRLLGILQIQTITTFLITLVFHLLDIIFCLFTFRLYLWGGFLFGSMSLGLRFTF